MQCTCLLTLSQKAAGFSSMREKVSCKTSVVFMFTIAPCWMVGAPYLVWVLEFQCKISVVFIFTITPCWMVAPPYLISG